MDSIVPNLFSSYQDSPRFPSKPSLHLDTRQRCSFVDLTQSTWEPTMRFHPASLLSGHSHPFEFVLYGHRHHTQDHTSYTCRQLHSASYPYLPKMEQDPRFQTIHCKQHMLHSRGTRDCNTPECLVLTGHPSKDSPRSMQVP